MVGSVRPPAKQERRRVVCSHPGLADTDVKNSHSGKKLAMGWQSLQGQQSPRCQSIKITENKKAQLIQSEFVK